MVSFGIGLPSFFPAPKPQTSLVPTSVPSFGTRSFKTRIPKPRASHNPNPPIKNVARVGVQEWSYAEPVPPPPAPKDIKFKAPRKQTKQKKRKNLVKFGPTSIISMHAKNEKPRYEDPFKEIERLYANEAAREKNKPTPKQKPELKKGTQRFITRAIHSAMLCAIEAALETESLKEARRVMREVLGMAAYTAMVKAQDAEKALKALGREKKERLRWTDYMLWD